LQRCKCSWQYWCLRGGLGEEQVVRDGGKQLRPQLSPNKERCRYQDPLSRQAACVNHVIQADTQNSSTCKNGVAE